jgi:uncharacterized SAM-binding protein YcdF (DUF218 family)
MPLASLIKPLLLPPAVLLLLLLAGLLLRRRWRVAGSAIACGAAGLLYLLSTPIVGGWLLRSQQTAPVLQAEAARTSGAGAIVVLGGDQVREQPEYGGDTVGEITLERLRWAARLQRVTGLPLLVAGGLLPHFTTPHGAAMAEALQTDFRVPVRWQETRSRTTQENAAFSAEILRAEGIRRVLLVTTAWHMPRAVQAFRVAGLDPVAAPTAFVVPGPVQWTSFLPAPGGLQASQWAIHEIFGRVWYRLAYG